MDLLDNLSLALPLSLENKIVNKESDIKLLDQEKSVLEYNKATRLEAFTNIYGLSKNHQKNEIINDKTCSDKKKKKKT